MRKRPHEFPDDILLRILSLLPVEIICRFKCVCKSWQQLLSSKDFARIHSLSTTFPSDTIAIVPVPSGFSDAIAPVRTGFSFIRITPEDSIESPPLVRPPSGGESLTQLACSNGMLCYTTYLNPSIHVCNPVTKQHLTLPVHPYYLPEIIAFYFDPVNHNFKLLIGKEHAVFSSAAGHWKQVAGLPASTSWQRPAICVRGICYQVCREDNQNRLSAFDMETESSERIQMPLQTMKECKKWLLKLVEWKGQVCLVHRAGDCEFEIWGLIEEDKNWEKVISVPINERFQSKITWKSLVVPHCNSLFVAQLDWCSVDLSLPENEHGRRKSNWQFKWHDPIGFGVLHGLYPFTPTLNYLGS
ncbi:hypothetical protein AMTRI_Chr08g167420 [Amborella trichopoda]